MYPYHLPVPWLTGASEWSLGIMAQSFLVTHFKHSSTVVYINENALTGAVWLPCLEIRSRNEETINSTLNTIYSLKVFYFRLYRRRHFSFFCFWSDLVLGLATTVNNVCGRRLYTKIQGPRFQRNNIIARDQKSDLHGTSFQSSPKINRMLITRAICHVYNKSLQHWTISVLLIKIPFFFFPTTQQCSLLPKKSTLSSNRIGAWTDTFRKSSRFNLS